jgi:hypothetical protein
MIWLLAHLVTTPSPVSTLSLFLRLPVYCRSSLLTGEGWGAGGGGAKSYHVEKAWSSINHTILSRFNFIDNLTFSSKKMIL